MTSPEERIPMHIVILGAGALGTVLGAHLTRAGEDVTLIARGQRAAYLQTHGATITGLVDFTIPVLVVTDPSQVHDANVLIVTVKTYDMTSALASVKHLDVGSVLSLQNGVLKYEQLAQTFGWDQVLGAMTTLGAEVLPTGSVCVTANQGLYLGELPTGISARAQTLTDTFTRAGIVAQVTPSIQALEWSKYVTFVCLMAPAVLTRLETYKFLHEAHTASIVAALVREMAQLTTTQGITLEDMAFFPIKTLSQLALDDMVTHVRQLGAQWASLRPTNKVSTLQDVERGKRLEVRRDPGLCGTAECCAWSYNTNDGHVLHTDRRDQSLSPVNRATCSIARHVRHRPSWYAR
jgi:2-dehydropantoate 2-reductase